MSIDDFVRYSKVRHALTADFVRAGPEDMWDFTPDPPGKIGRAPAQHRIGAGFAPFCKQLRHVVCVRGVYTAALATRNVVWARKHEHYVGPLTREALLTALDDKQRNLLATLETVDIDAPIDWDGTLLPSRSLRGSLCSTRRSITVSGASMLRSPDSKRRSAGERRGACEDRHEGSCDPHEEQCVAPLSTSHRVRTLGRLGCGANQANEVDVRQDDQTVL